MKNDKFVLLTATFDDDAWAKAKNNFGKFQRTYSDRVVFIAAGIWLIDRTKAETALMSLVEQIHRLRVPFVVAPMSSRPTIGATESELQLARDVGLEFYPMPFSE